MREIANLREQVFGLTPTVLVGLSFYAQKGCGIALSTPGGRAAAGLRQNDEMSSVRAKVTGLR